MNDKVFIILSWIVGILFVFVLFLVVFLLGYSFFDCDFSFFMWGIERLITLTGGVQ